MSGREEDIFLDALGQEEEITPRRPGRKRRSTAGSGSQTSSKKPKAAKMPMARSPGKGGKGAQPDGSTDQDAFWKRMEAMLGGVESRMKEETTGMREVLDTQLADLKGKVEENEKRMDDMMSRVEYLVEQKVDEKLASGKSRGVGADVSVGSEGREGGACGSSPESSLRSYAGAAKSGVVRVRVDPEKRKMEQYWDRRRAIRIRPVADGKEEDEVRKYLEAYLKMSRSTINTLGLERSVYERVPYGPKTKHQRELIIRFPSVEARDLVKSAARNLAGRWQEFGVRHELPDLLKTAMSDLQAVSYDIKRKHPEARRNVLFDDNEMDLVLDFSLREGDVWRRVTSRQARGRKAAVSRSDEKKLGDEELDRILGGEDEEAVL